jgi:TetR/AcrR family transcriptional repressor of lmrAB and yxaGH operons
MTDAQKTLLGSGYEAGCPLATIALESTAGDRTIRQAVAKGFEAIRATLKNALLSNGLDSARAGSLAALIVSAYEGGLIQARVAGSKKPLQDTSHMLLDVLRSNLSNNQP